MRRFGLAASQPERSEVGWDLAHGRPGEGEEPGETIANQGKGESTAGNRENRQGSGAILNV